MNDVYNEGFVNLFVYLQAYFSLLVRVGGGFDSDSDYSLKPIAQLSISIIFHQPPPSSADELGSISIVARKSIPYHRPPNNHRPPQISLSSRALNGKRRE